MEVKNPTEQVGTLAMLCDRLGRKLLNGAEQMAWIDPVDGARVSLMEANNGQGINYEVTCNTEASQN